MSTAETKPAAKPARRAVRYQNLDELQAEAQRAVDSGATTTGGWTLAQILEHLARGMDGAVDGFPFQSPWYVRLVARYILLPRFLKRGMPSGFKLKGASADALIPGEVNLAEALVHLNRSIERMREVDNRKPHPIFGPMTTEQSTALQLRHAELHMSFVAL